MCWGSFFQGDDDQMMQDADKQMQNILVDIQTPQLQKRALQCILGTFGLPGSLMLNAVNTVIDSMGKLGKVICVS